MKPWLVKSQFHHKHIIEESLRIFTTNLSAAGNELKPNRIRVLNIIYKKIEIKAIKAIISFTSSNRYKAPAINYRAKDFNQKFERISEMSQS